QVEAMLYALCESIARMVTSLQKGAFAVPVYFVGGVAANGAIAKALSEAVSARNGHPVQVTVPQNYLYIQALGAALLSRERTSRVSLLPGKDSRQSYFETPRLPDITVPDGQTGYIIEKPSVGYLGVDVGSTSTKATIIDESGSILTKNYLMTAGRPIDAVKDVFRNLIKSGAANVSIAGVGVTGSGRYLIGSLIGADLIKNEITAQTRAAAEIDPKADIIEIGGQDSKLVIKRNGVVVDYQMNKACAAGTGSFIDELAEMMGISVRDGEFANLAFAAPYTIDLGTRCAAFMGQAVPSAQREGVSLEVITASLANSIAKNYLSKVVGARKLGSKVILTGAVFYNQAIVAAFNQQLPGKTLTVAEHREVSGAIGAAILARESINGNSSKFKGFQAVIDSELNLSTFVCKGCDNNCTITRMQTPDEKPTFYGSRCDRYDSTLTQGKKETFFDQREKLLFRDYKPDSGTGPVVGIPRSLLVYDYAPLLIGFLNALDARVVLSGKTSKEIMEQAVELSYTDSCFPVKLLHGHAAALNSKVDYIIFPSAIRLGKKDGDENQKYACPLVQASPFIIRQVLDLGERLLIPTIDFSQGNTSVIDSLSEMATRMGFSRKQGKKAAAAGIDAQQQFETNRAALGKKLLRELRESDQLGVVLLSRSYMSQDSGANLGIAEKLAQLDVVPIPLDFLPLSDIDPKEYSDRPYWMYESKFIAGGAITAGDAKLYGLALTNFGCGPNSFILPVLEDIMGGKPLGELEIDEHAAEAGIVTRLEAFVDTIKGYHLSGRPAATVGKDVYRGTSTRISSGKTLVLLRMAPYVEAIAAAMEAFGVKVIVLPEPDECSLLSSNQLTSGTECLPYRITLGDWLRFCNENGKVLADYEGFTAGSYGPCRFGKYSIEQTRILRNAGFDLPIGTTVSNNAYRDFGLGAGFERLAWRSIVAVDYLQKLLWRTRPYEKEAGTADRLFDESLARIADYTRRQELLEDTLQQATREFKAIMDPDMPRKPLVGINGEIYLRSNRFSNNDLVKVCEAAGLEVVVAPIGEWVKYISHRNVEDAVRDRKIKKMVIGYIKKRIQEQDERQIAGYYREVLGETEPPIAEVLAKSRQHLSPKCGSEAVLSIGGGIEWL
ncbi:acyl-CoA dehydratase activase-related protein, partial [Chloroflexota bacterium]